MKEAISVAQVYISEEFRDRNPGMHGLILTTNEQMDNIVIDGVYKLEELKMLPPDIEI